MTSTFDDLVAACPDASDGACTRCENPAVEDCITAAPGKRWMRGVEGHDVGPRADLKSRGRLRQRSGAAGERSVEQRTAGRNARAAGQHVALAVLQPLAILELTEFVGDANQDIGIRADAEPAARIKEFAGWKNAVAENSPQ